MRKLAALVVLAAACGNQDNLIVGGVSGGATTPDVIFDDIGSSIHGIATLRDDAGNPLGDPMAIVIMSNRPGLCSTLNAKRDYFRNAPEAYEALVLIMPLGYLGTFIIGREGTDATTAAEIVAASGPQTTTPFHALNGSYIAITNWDDKGGNATGSFNVAVDDPYGSGVAHPFYGKFKTGFCPNLEGTLLP
ncbi:MAG: hypothetical protein ABR567_03335 [Myxococcales bacterium]|nr:hypothetical protein [Myxococcales bacterium]